MPTVEVTDLGKGQGLGFNLTPIVWQKIERIYLLPMRILAL